MLRTTSYVIIIFSTLLFVLCRSTEHSTQVTQFENLHDTVDYVGMSTCASCHGDIYKTFIRTGMGESFHFATREKSAATFDNHSTIYDSINDFYYQPFWKSDSLYISEYRLEGKDTLHKRVEKVKYIVGSGQHTNSHIYEENGYLRQAPITFYTQEGIWDLAPGFEGGFSSRFNRIIGRQCLSCHNSTPEPVEKAENKYHSVPLGIGCERCHGPGEAHVNQKLAGIIVDTATQIDYSIVNPTHLDREGQLNVCGRCHLQGVTVLKEDATFESWRPGGRLNETMDIFLPKYDGAQTQFIMASQAQRMQMSKCFIKSEMTCLSCHNPHVSVKDTPRKTFNAACKNCHQSEESCTATLTVRQSENDDCSGCHMRKSGSIDIPHVEITDHFIRKPLSEEELSAPQNMIGLECVTSTQVQPEVLGQAYLSFYEEFSPKPALLDSAAHYLSQATASATKKKAMVHLHYLKQNFDALINTAPAAQNISDPWTAYRVGEAYEQQQKPKSSLDYFKKAVELQGLNLDFQNKLANNYFALGNIADADKHYTLILSETKSNTVAMNNLSYIKIRKGQINKAEALVDEALKLNPDYVQALLNKAAIAKIRDDVSSQRKIAKRILELDPSNEQAERLLENVN